MKGCVLGHADVIMPGRGVRMACKFHLCGNNETLS